MATKALEKIDIQLAYGIGKGLKQEVAGYLVAPHIGVHKRLGRGNGWSVVYLPNGLGFGMIFNTQDVAVEAGRAIVEIAEGKPTWGDATISDSLLKELSQFRDKVNAGNGFKRIWRIPT
jgi:hypothetical protein